MCIELVLKTVAHGKAITPKRNPSSACDCSQSTYDCATHIPEAMLPRRLPRPMTRLIRMSRSWPLSTVSNTNLLHPSDARITKLQSFPAPASLSPHRINQISHDMSQALKSRALVEANGIEPMTSGLQSRRSPS